MMLNDAEGKKAKIDYQAIIQYIKESPIDIPFTGTADETFLWLQGYREAVNRIIGYLEERRVCNADAEGKG